MDFCDLQNMHYIRMWFLNYIRKMNYYFEACQNCERILD